MRLSILAVAVTLLVAASGFASMIPTIANGGFEETAPGNDAPGWGWQCGAAAGFHSDTTNPHSGKRCLQFFNNSELIPNVYGRLSQGVGVLPGTEYELSAWVRGEDVAPGQHFTDWNSYTMNLPSGTFDWKKVTLRFRTRNDQGGLALGINIVNKAKVLAIDDINLTPIGTPLNGKGISGSFLVQGRVSGDNKPADLALMLDSTLDGARVAVRIAGGGQTLLDKSEPIRRGENTIEMKWNSGAVLTRKLELAINVLDSQGNAVASARKPIEKLSTGVLLAEIDKVEKRLNGEFMALYNKCRAQGIPLDYPTATKTMLEQFIPLEREDAQKNEQRRADFAITDFNRALDDSIRDMRAYLANPEAAPVVPRYQSTGPVRIDGLSLIGARRDSRGKIDQGPLFFCGYGHFSQIRTDMHRWPGYGINIIQSADFGPSAIFPEEGKIDLEAAERLVRTLDDAAKKNVKVDFLISPHFFPDWARAKWPNLNHAVYAFCVDEPEGRYIIEKFLRIVVPMIKDKPALNSFCLTNEPAFDRPFGCPSTKPLFVNYLKGLYGDIGTLNETYGTSYKDFDEVPVGGGYADPQYYDYCMFNKKRFAAWHQWMADIIHEMMPDAAVHAKECVVLDLPNRQYSPWGVDIEMFSQFSQLNGNDCYIMPAEGFWGIGWHLQNLTLDLQRSMGRKPVFDSEHHLQPDGSTGYVPPQHYRTALWQGAIHGQGLSTQWIWERAGHPSFYGNVMDRPGCALATGTTCMDLNRFATEVTWLQVKKAPVAVLYSKASFMKDAAYVDAMNRCHEALNFCGVKVDFISENQLVAGKGRDYRMIVLPQSTHLPAASFKALCELPRSTRLVTVGDAPNYDPYHKPLPQNAVNGLVKRSFAIKGDVASERMWPALMSELGKLGALPSVSVVDVKSGKPVWGVEWLPAKIGRRLIINMVNLTSKPVDVRIVSNGEQVEAKDLLSLLSQEKVKTLEPITPVLAEATSL